MYRILVLATGAFILGILAAQYHYLLFSLLFIGGLIFSTFYIASAANPQGLDSAKVLGIILLLILFFGGGVLRTELAQALIKTPSFERGKVQTLEGQIVAEAQVYEKRVVYTVKIDRPWKTKILVNVLTEKDRPFEYGDYIRVQGALELPARAKNPGEFDYRQYLWRQGITLEVTVRPEQVHLVKKGWGNPLLELALGAKNKVIRAVEEYLPQKEANLFNSVFFGDKGLLTPSQKQLYGELGILHVFAVSGSNVATVMLVLLGLAVLLRLSPRARNCLMVLGLVFYTCVTGLTPSVIRASLMAFGILVSQWVLRRWDFYTGLALAALVLLLINPYYLQDSGFQLSFVVTWGLVYLTPFLDKVFIFLPLWRSLLTVTLAAQLVALPIIAYYFNIVSLAALWVNLLVVPVMGVIVTLGMVVFLLALLWPPLAAPFIFSAGFLLNLLARFLEWVGGFPWVAVKVPTPGLLLIILSYASLIALVELEKCKDRYPLYFKLTVVLCISVLAGYFFPSTPHGQLEVTFIDVGQGDAIFIQTPQGRRFLLDGGGENFTGTYNLGERVVVPYLIRRGIFSLDGVISSHPDGDHLAGLFPVLKEIKVNRVFTPPVSHFAQQYDEFINLALSQGSILSPLTAGDKIKVDGGKVMLEVLHPSSFPDPGSTSNNNTLVLRLIFGRHQFLFTGDLEVEGMKKLLASSVPLTSTILKIPHHGSPDGFDLEFYRAVSPKAVVISVGKNNFGHPAQEIVDYWTGQGVKVYRTDWDGAVTFLSDGQRLLVRTMGREVALW